MSGWKTLSFGNPGSSRRNIVALVKDVLTDEFMRLVGEYLGTEGVILTLAAFTCVTEFSEEMVVEIHCHESSQQIRAEG